MCVCVCVCVCLLNNLQIKTYVRGPCYVLDNIVGYNILVT